MENNYGSIKNHAMMVLENIRIGGMKGGIGKLKFEQNAPPRHIVNFLENNKLIFFKKTDRKSIDDQVVLITEKGGEELKEYFKYK